MNPLLTDDAEDHLGPENVVSYCRFNLRSNEKDLCKAGYIRSQLSSKTLAIRQSECHSSVQYLVDWAFAADTVATRSG